MLLDQHGIAKLSDMGLARVMTKTHVTSNPQAGTAPCESVPHVHALYTTLPEMAAALHMRVAGRFCVLDEVCMPGTHRGGGRVPAEGDFWWRA